MSQIQVSCPNCGYANVATIDQSFIDGRLRWYISVNCPVCGVYELDDIGMPDEKTRDQLIQQTGLWELISEDNNRSVIGRVIKNALKISLKEVVDTLKSMLIIYVGTKTECEWISFLLKKEGVLTKIEKRDRY